MKAGTSSISCWPGPATMTDRSRASPATFSDSGGRTLAGRAAAGPGFSGRSSSFNGALSPAAPSAGGQTSSSARNSAAPSGSASGRSGNTVSRIATNRAPAVDHGL